MRKELIELRSVMEREGINIWISPCSDAHGSEYLDESDECIRFLTGFTGDSCTVLVTPDEAFLWTDGRYFVQAAIELKDTGVELMKMGEPGVPMLMETFSHVIKEGDKAAFFAPLLDARRGMAFAKAAEKKGASLITDKDLIKEIWAERPKRSAKPVFVHDEKYAGASVQEKLSGIRKVMEEKEADLFVTGALDECGWTLNLRGSDIVCNPCFLSFLIIGKDETTLFVQEEALTDKARKALADNEIIIRAYDDFSGALSEIRGKNILIDITAANYDTYVRLKAANTLIDCLSPAAAAKCVKNETEIAHMKACHIRDGAYLSKYLYRLKKMVSEGKIFSETEAGDILDGIRAEDPLFLSNSFPTISAYAANAAMCHYEPKPETASKIYGSGLYLVDSGAQYYDGTTDVTRTIGLGETTAEEKRNYTLTVIGMLNLLHAVFPYGTRGMNLDILARKPLWERGLDFNHGTGHGVGFLNNVHEMPVAVRFRPNPDAKRDLPYVPGMVTSDEPGYYKDGGYGIRTENLIVCVPHDTFPGFLKFETLTYAPLDPSILDVSVMSDDDLACYNEYQQAVYEKISALLNDEEREWLKNETREIRR